MESLFHPLIAPWFLRRFGQPTEIQKRAWPRIAANEHVLITAPTGSGKTLAAFLAAIDGLVRGRIEPGHTSILYISPLKALNNDIRRNLLGPIEELREIFKTRDVSFPKIDVQTRSGDTPQSHRRRMQRHPPEILITTPESLNLLLSSEGGRTLLCDISTVILDEIHAVVGTKRGSHLITAVDRLVLLSGEFQRIALSATVRPEKIVADFIGGYRMSGVAHEPSYDARSVSLITSMDSKKYAINVQFPETADGGVNQSFGDHLAKELSKTIENNQATLFFTNSRRSAENLTLKINNRETDGLVAYAHHGSLSRETRTEIEQKLKAGELKAIVATNSLELGIDIGTLDKVVLIQSPPTISAAIQRIGRAGHNVGEISRGTIFPTFPQDLLEAAVLVTAIFEHDIEEIEPVECPLDVLAQVIVSMTSVETWDIDKLYAFFKSSYPFRELPRDRFDLVLAMLCGRYVGSRIRELQPRVSVDRLDNTATATKGARLALFLSGGMIPDRGYFHLKHTQTGARIGELDEEFVWEAALGQVLTLGTQNWRIEKITHNDVFVVPQKKSTASIPFWKGEGRRRDFHFSTRIAGFLESVDDRLDDPDLAATLTHKNRLDDVSACHLIDFLRRQKETTGCSLPHRHHIVVEHVKTGPSGVPGSQVVIHTMWGGRVNYPFAMALAAAWEDRFGYKPRIFPENDCLVVVLEDDVGGDEILSLVSVATMQELLKRRLEASGFFGARFRECAGRSLLITKDKHGKRLPLWMNRLRSQKLLDVVRKFPDFPILLEAWRTCLQDEFDLRALQLVLSEIESGIIRWSEAYTTYPSPMARTVTWRQTNEYMYSGDEPLSHESSKLRDDLLRDVVFSPGIRPTVSQHIVDKFELKRKRLFQGYAPTSAHDLLDWVKERVLIPISEWQELLKTMSNDSDSERDSILKETEAKLVQINPKNAAEPLVGALESIQRIISAFYEDFEAPSLQSISPNGIAPRVAPNLVLSSGDPHSELLSSVLAEFLAYYGPVTPAFLQKSLGIEEARLVLGIEDLADSQRIIGGSLISDTPDRQICDSDNFEILLRLSRAEAIPSFDPLPIEQLPTFLARHQGITSPAEDIDGLFRVIEQLLCLPLQVQSWETDIFPARIGKYKGSWLDSIVHEGQLRWIGSGVHRILFTFSTDFELVQDDSPSENIVETVAALSQNGSKIGPGEQYISDLLPDPSGRYEFGTLLATSGLSSTELSAKLWQAVWQGDLTNDTFACLRRGIDNQFKPSSVGQDPSQLPRRGRHVGRTSFSKWKGSLPWIGNWFLLPDSKHSENLIDLEERRKDRVRILLDRYGILFRELLMRELPPFRWSRIFRSLRLMELSGELLSGCFFQGIPGLQFISKQAFRMLQDSITENTPFWINTADPASLCGTELEALKGKLPRRSLGTYLVYKATELVLIVTGHGSKLEFNVPPDDPKLPEYLGVLTHLLSREFQPKRKIKITAINGERPDRSPYLETLQSTFSVTIDHKGILLYKRV